jgi:nitrogen fixation protein FixH
MKNAWPIGLVVFFVLFVTSTVGFVMWTTHHREDLVAADYYDQEIRFQQRIDATARASAAGMKPAVSYDRAAGSLSLRFADAAALGSATGTVALYRPSDAALDQAFAFAPDAAGSQTISAALASGLWRVKVDWQKNGHAFFAEEAVIVP